jgi:hypothetical protein
VAESLIKEIKSTLFDLSLDANFAYRRGKTLESLKGQLEALIIFLYESPYKNEVERCIDLLHEAYQKRLSWWKEWLVKPFNKSKYIEMLVREKLPEIMSPANTLLSLAELYAATLPKVSSVKEVEEIPQMGIDIETFKEIHYRILEDTSYGRDMTDIVNDLRIYVNAISQLPFSPAVQEVAQSLLKTLEGGPSSLREKPDAYELAANFTIRLTAMVKKELEIVEKMLKRRSEI